MQLPQSVLSRLTAASSLHRNRRAAIARRRSATTPILECLESRAMLSGTNILTALTGQSEGGLPTWHNALTGGLNAFIQALPSQYRSTASQAVSSAVATYHDELVAAIPSQVLGFLSGHDSGDDNSDDSGSDTSGTESETELPAWHDALTDGVDNFIQRMIPARLRPAAYEVVGSVVDEYHDDLVDSIPGQVLHLLGSLGGDGGTAPVSSALTTEGAPDGEEPTDDPSDSEVMTTTQELPAWHNALTGAIGGLIEVLPERYQSQASHAVGHFVDEYHDDLVAAIPMGFFALLNSNDDSDGSTDEDENGDSESTVPVWHQLLTGGIQQLIHSLPSPWQGPAMQVVDRFVENYHDDLVNLVDHSDNRMENDLLSFWSDHRNLLNILS